MKPTPSNIKDNKAGLYGSMGMPKDDSTGGGGKVYINVDSIQLHKEGAQLRANGAPNRDKKDNDDLHGGSGGYIYVKTSEKSKANDIDKLA